MILQSGLAPRSAGEALAVRIGGAMHEIAAERVVEVFRADQCRWTRVPYAAASLLGVAHWRGTLLPIVSAARLLGEAEEAPPSARVVVLDCVGRVGLLVDAVRSLGPAGSASMLDPEPLLARDYQASRPRAGAASDLPVGPRLDKAAARESVALLVLQVMEQAYGLALDQVREVVALPAVVTPVSAADPVMLGVMNHHGAVLPLVSLRALLGAPGRAHAGCVVVVALAAGLVGLVVDAAREIATVAADSIEPVPPVLMRGAGEARIAAICRLDAGSRLLPLLAPSLLFDAQTQARLVAQCAAPMSGTVTMPSCEKKAPAAPVVVFRLGGERYGLPIDVVREVVRPPERLGSVPHAPAFLAGVMNLRGIALPVIAQRGRFAAAAASGSGVCKTVLVVRLGALQAGFAVDAVDAVLHPAADALRALPALAADANGLFSGAVLGSEFSAGNGDAILLIEPGALLSGTERDLLAGFALRTEPVPA